ncbi:MAG: Holliday junction resolvase RuvX [Rhodospirillales bacterium]|nr:Holliday junction resolvase RuvX [Rhodospirillales bacterium]
MSILTTAEFRQSVPHGKRIMGLDVGTKTVGVSLSDVLHMIASPLETIMRKKFRDDIVRFQKIVKDHEVGGVLLGLPLSMDGTEGPRCQSIRAFADNLGEVFDMPITFWDERLSTSAVERMLVNDVDMSRKRRSEVIDKLAAVYILQGFLDATK